MVKHCEKRDAGLVYPPQDHHQPQEAAAALQTDDEDEELGHYLHADSRVGSRCLSELDFHDGNHYATQETISTSSQLQAGTNTEDRCADFPDGSLEDHRDPGPVQSADAEVQSLGNLPPSDSFADFCSAPSQEDGEGLWADFEDQSAPLEGKAWSRFREPVSRLQTDGEEKEREMTRMHGDMRWNSCKVSLSCRVQHLLESSFPTVTVPGVEGEEGLLNLGALLQLQHPPKSEEETPELSCAQSSLRIQQVMVWPHLDLHNSVGLQFRWAGSHSNRTLLRCLGVDTENIVFVGRKKQPVTVSTCKSSLVSRVGMLELTKDSVPAVCSPGRTAISAPLRPHDQLDPPEHSVPLPSGQLAWSSRGLSSSPGGPSSRRAPHFWGWK
ncbi:aftiphilin [Xenentodon cancila]